VGDAKRLAEKSETEVEDLSGVQRASDYFFNTLALMGDGRHLVHDFQGLPGMDSLIGALREAGRELKKQEDFSGMWDNPKEPGARGAVVQERDSSAAVRWRTSSRGSDGGRGVFSKPVLSMFPGCCARGCLNTCPRAC
jgi:hypothetical protein